MDKLKYGWAVFFEDFNLEAFTFQALEEFARKTFYKLQCIVNFILLWFKIYKEWEFKYVYFLTVLLKYHENADVPA